MVGHGGIVQLAASSIDRLERRPQIRGGCVTFTTTKRQGNVGPLARAHNRGGVGVESLQTWAWDGLLARSANRRK